MAEWKKVGNKSDMPEAGEAREFSVGDKMVCIANIAGQYHALDNVCVHRGGPLGQGVVMDDKLVCPWHGWVYDPLTGVPDVNPNLKVQVYPIKVEGEDVMVEI